VNLKLCCRIHNFIPVEVDAKPCRFLPEIAASFPVAPRRMSLREFRAEFEGTLIYLILLSGFASRLAPWQWRKSDDLRDRHGQPGA
jgi:hypothetical protein